jgi:aspartate racemase
MEKTIGIVAGVGPFAGLDLLGKVLAETAVSRDQHHLPIYSLSQPGEIVDRTEYLLGLVAENPAYAIARQLERLAALGAAVAGIPCNTAHAPPIFSVIQTELSAADCPIHLLHMIEEVGRFLAENHPGIKRVGVLSTTGTYRAAVYPQVLATAGCQAIAPDENTQMSLVHPAIYDPVYGVKATGTATERAREGLITAVATLRARGAQAIILGCTELPLVLPEKELNGLPTIDPTRILARALIREANASKLR